MKQLNQLELKLSTDFDDIIKTYRSRDASSITISPKMAIVSQVDSPRRQEGKSLEEERSNLINSLHLGLKDCQNMEEEMQGVDREIQKLRTKRQYSGCYDSKTDLGSKSLTHYLS